MTAVAITVVMAACGHGGDQKVDSVSAPVEEYHADNDIAMTVRSLADAIRVGEPLDTADYNFEGVLTDGMGRPLYTDVQGMPGVWDVEVLSSTSAVIRNMNVGDLLSDDLQSYLESCLELSEDNMISEYMPDAESDDELDRVIYDFDGGYLRIDTRAATAANGLEGPLMTITVSKQKPPM